MALCLVLAPHVTDDDDDDEEDGDGDGGCSRWWTKDTLAVVTGANKGIGFEIAKQLAHKGLTVVLTSRDQQRGLAALAKLQADDGLSNLVFHPLDVRSSDSVSKFASWLVDQYNGLDILVNNAAVADGSSSYEKARLVLDTNYEGVKQVTKALLPCMRASAAGARIVNISSGLGQLQVVSSSLRQEMENPAHLTEEKVDAFVNQFLQDVQEGNVMVKGWPSGGYAAYCVSKLALNAYTRVLAKTLQNQPSGHKIYVNCMHPGFVSTDMNNHQGHLSPEEGADTAVWLALMPIPVPSGEFFYQRKPYSF